jgi:hypothetical protein
MNRIYKLLLSAWCVCLITTVFSGAAVSAGAVSGVSQAAQTNLPAGILIGDQDGIYADAHGIYYIDARSLKPGDVIRKTLTLQNLEQNDKTPEGKTPYTLTMTAEPLWNKGPIDLLDSVALNLTLDGKTVYQGPCRGDGTPNMIQKALDLGVYKVGDRHMLEITLTVDPAMPIFEEKSEADFKWHFYAYRAQEDDDVKTGILESYLYLLPIGGTLLLLTLIIPLKKRRERHIAAQETKTV